jgi:hypothetical protein
MNKSDEAVTITPLHFFDSDAELVRLNERVSIRTIEERELKPLIERTQKSFGKTLELSLFDTKYVIENGTTSRNVWEHVEDTILALRLLKSGDVKFSTAFWKKGEETAIGHISGVSHRTNYFLKKEETEKLKTLWQKVQELSTKPYLDYPIRNFMSAYDRTAFEDKIVDCVVALESLVFYQENETIKSAGKVIGIAIGSMLGMNQEERNMIKKTLTEAYGMRNARVHGNVEKLAKLNVKDMERIYNGTEDCLRRALRKLIEE